MSPAMRAPVPKRRRDCVSFGVAFATALLAAILLLPASALANGQVSNAGVLPKSNLGNFVASDDDQVCFELERLGHIGAVTADMRGFKIDPPANFTSADGFVEVSLSLDGRFLSWRTTGGAEMVAIIVKGGPNYNLYNYVGREIGSDGGLSSPLTNKKYPQISHYNVCYKPPARAGEGCTPGYWRNHGNRWLGVAPGDDFDVTFGVSAFDPDKTLGQAIWLPGGGLDALARHATAALLNAHGGVPNTLDSATVNYPYTVDQVIAMTQAAISSGDASQVEAVKDLFDAANNLGCPLSGTRVDRVPG